MLSSTLFVFRLFAKGTSNLSLDKLKQTCSEYLSLQFPMGQLNAKSVISFPS